MADWKFIAKLRSGWVLMLAGAIVLFDSSTPFPPRRSEFFSILEVLGGFVLVVVGLWLRRRAARS